VALINDLTQDEEILQTSSVDGLGASVDGLGASVENEEDVISEKMPPLYTFGDQKLFQEKLEELGIERVTRDIVEIAKPAVPHFNFTYEELRDGSADVLDVINPTDLPYQTRAMSDEAILALFTDVEDFGKYESKAVAKNPDGSPKLDSTGAPVYEKKRYNLSAFASGLKPAIVESGFLTIGGWQGARLGAAAYASRVPKTGVRPLDVAGKVGAAGIGAVVGSGVLMKPAEYVNEWLFDEPDPIVVPSLQAAYNAGETTGYGISFLATPWVGTRLAGPKLSSTFNATKSLEDFKTIASSNFKPEALQKMFGQELVQKAKESSVKQAARGPVSSRLLPDLTKGPTGARITTALTTGGALAMKTARENPRTFLGVEALVAGGAGISAYQAEKMAPGSEGVRFGMEIISAPLSMKIIPPITGTAKKTYGVVKQALAGGLSETGGVMSQKLDREATSRIIAELESSPEFLESETAEKDLSEAIDALLNFDGDEGTLASEILGAPSFGANQDSPSPFAGRFLDIEDQLSTKQDELSVATERGKERFVARAKMNIMKLRETRTPEGLQLAAHIEQRLVEQELIDQIETGNQKLINAAEQLFGNTEVQRQDVELSERFYDLQLRLIAGFKKRRDDLYKAVPDFDVKTFSTADGTKVRQPNSLTIFDIPAMEGGLKFSSAGAQGEFNRILGPYKDDFKLFDEYFNPPVDADGNFNPSDQPEFPVQFSRLREMLSHFKSVKAERLKVNANDSMATHVDSLIKAIDQDINGVDATGFFITQEGEVLQPDQASIVEALSKAKAFNFGLHNVTSRTYLSQFSKRNAQRGMVLDPTESIKAVKKGDDIPLTRINEMQDAVNFLNDPKNEMSTITKIDIINPATGQRSTNVPFDKEQTGLELNEIFEAIIRDARKNIVDVKPNPEGGNEIRIVNPKKLTDYMNRPTTKEMLKIFPNIRTSLQSVEEAQVLVNAYQANLKSFQNTAEQKAFQLFLDRPESSSQVIGTILGGKKGMPAKKTLQIMVDKIKHRGTFQKLGQDGEVLEEYTSAQVLDGLRASIMNYAVIKSGGSGVGFSPTILFDTLFADVASVDASEVGASLKLIDFLKSNGIVDKEYVDNLQKAISQMRNVEEGLAKNDLSGNLFKNPSLFSMGMHKVGGAMAGSAALAKFKAIAGKFGLDVGGAGIVMGNVGANAGEKIFLHGPEAITINNMARLMADPEALAIAIKTHSTGTSFIEEANTVNKIIGGLSVSAMPKIIRDVTADESFIRPFDLGDKKADYSKQKVESAASIQSRRASDAFQQKEKERRQREKNKRAEAPVAPAPQLQVPMPPPTPAPAPVAQSTAPNPGPVDRSMYAAMFPNDVASSLIRQQGIGSLMG